MDASALIPHRGAMLLISSVLDVSAIGGAPPSVEAAHDVRLDEPCYREWGLRAGPWPRTLMIEFLGQTAALLCAYVDAERAGRVPLFARAKNAVFSGDALPGDTVIGRVTIERTIGPASFVRASARAGDRLLCTVERATIFYPENWGGGGQGGLGSP